jgi:hypothetical protein
MTVRWPDEVAVTASLDRTDDSPEQIARCVDLFVNAFTDRLAASSWVLEPGGAPLPADSDELGEVIRARPSAAATGEPDAADGYELDLHARVGDASVTVGVDVGGRHVGRRRPTQNVFGRILNPSGSPVDPGLATALLEALVAGWQPLFASASDADLNVAAGRRGWQAPAGRRVWLRDGTVALAAVADGVTTRSFCGGTVLSAPDDWSAEQVATALVETYERNGVDAVPH